jgi:predicted site-specific integrase-resolvase
MRTLEIATGKGLAVVEACRMLGIAEQTYHRWKKEYGGLRMDQAKWLKRMEPEGARLKRTLEIELAGERQVQKPAKFNAACES